jgi:hypothetical protein
LHDVGKLNAHWQNKSLSLPNFHRENPACYETDNTKDRLGMLQGRKSFENLGILGEIILKYIFEKYI